MFLPIQALRAFCDRGFKPFADGFTHSRDGKQMKRFVHGNPVVLGNQDCGTVSFIDLHDPAGFRDIFDELRKIFLGCVCGDRCHNGEKYTANREVAKSEKEKGDVR